MEKSPNINSSIEKIRTLEDCMNELMSFQLKYIERVDQGVIKIPNINNSKREFSNNFLKILTESTSIEGYLEDEYLKRLPNPEDRKNNDFNYKKGYFVGGIMHQIYELYSEDKDNWKSRTMELLDSKVKELGPIVNDLDELSNKKENKCGLINFDVDKIRDPKNIEKLNALGLNSYDDYINIHLKNLLEQKIKDPSVNINQINKSLSLLAEKIVDEYPQTKAVIGRSWIMDSKIRKILKFEILNRHEGSVFSSSGFWGQFIDKNGFIKKDEMDKFLNTGEAEFYPAESIMMVNDFLKEYLPEYKKRLIKLKEITEESKKFIEDMSLIRKELNENWDKLTYEDIVSLITKNQELSDFFKTKDGQDYLGIIKKVKELNLDMKDIDGLDYENRDEIKKRFDDFIKEKSSQYSEKEVNIK